jgi:hypothetical protein
MDGMVALMFDWYAFADYSGARSLAEQRKHIAWAVDQGSGTAITLGITREELLEAAVSLLLKAKEQGKRVVFGFDHNYGFPQGLHEALFGSSPADWRQTLEGYAASVAESMYRKQENGPRAGAGGMGAGSGREKTVPAVSSGWSPRNWARESNARIAGLLGAGHGPFWGTRFERRPELSLFRSYKLPDGTSFELRERRLAEERFRRLKPAYQISGIGTVGQQSLYGILYLRELLHRCRQEGIPVHVWPQDGMAIPEGSHMAVEVYPTLLLMLEGITAPRTDSGDAAACVQWLRRMDGEGQLESMLSASFSPEDWERARLEGWVLGVAP